MKMEILDIFDENYNHIGTETKENVHKKGLWHQVAGCIFIDSSTNRIIFQYKNATHNEVAHLNKIDISVGGHIQAGETLTQGIIREINEESSLDVLPEELQYAGYRTTNVDATEDYLIREFCHIFLLDRQFKIEELHSNDDEVLYFISFDIDELLAFILNRISKVKGITPHGEETFTKDNFIKGYLTDHIYEAILLISKGYITKQKQALPIELTLK